MQQHRARLTPEQRQAEREADAARHRERRLLQALKNEDNHGLFASAFSNCNSKK